MQEYMKKYMQVALANYRDEQLDIKISQQELFDIQQTILDFSNLICYEDNLALQNTAILKDAFTKDMFFKTKFVANTFEYNQVVNKIRALKKLENNQTYSVVNNQLSNMSSTEIKDVYEKHEDCIKYYYKLSPFYDRESKTLSITYLDAIKQIDGYYSENGVHYFPLDNGDYATVYEEGKQIKLLGYDERKNPFKNGHIRVFSYHGEMKDLSRLNYIDIIKKVRNAESHHNIKIFANGHGYGGKVIDLGDGRCVLMSNRWHEYMLDLSNCSYKGEGSTFKFLYIPKTEKSVRTPEECLNLIDNCKVVHIQTSKDCDVNAINQIVNNILENYYNTPNNNIRLVDYVDTHLRKHITGFNLSVAAIRNPELLKRRLVNDNEFYKMRKKDKENAHVQAGYIDSLVKTYGLDFIDFDCVKENGKAKDMKVDLKQINYAVNANLTYLQACSDIKGAENIPVMYVPESKQEKFISLCAVCIYNNLIRNNFIDDIKYTHLTNFKSYSANAPKKSTALKEELKKLDMSMFEITNKRKKTAEPVKTFEDKVSCLKTIRNSVSHNNIHIQYNKNCDIKESKFVFCIKENNNQKIKVNCEKFLEFINNPLFSDYTSERVNDLTLQIKNVEELEQYVLNTCKKAREQILIDKEKAKPAALQQYDYEKE